MIFFRTKQENQEEVSLAPPPLRPKWMFILRLFLFVGVSAVIISMAMFIWGSKKDAGLLVDFDLGFAGLSSNIVNLEITGHDNKKRFYVLTAASARPKDNTRFMGAIMEEGFLSEVEVSLELGDNDWLSLRSQRGSFNNRQQKLLVGPNFDIYTSNGYQMHGVSLSIDLKTGTAIVKGKVEGFGPLGEINAAAMDAKNGGEFMRFYGGVEVLLLPRGGKSK